MLFHFYHFPSLTTTVHTQLPNRRRKQTTTMGEQRKTEEEEGCCDVPKKIIFGRYEIGRLLGKGTFAKVYHGKHLETGDGVAIKIIDKDQIRREGLVDQLVREISVMRLVRHPNVVEIREVMATRSRVFFVMEYVRGGELFSKVARGKLQEDMARKYFQQLISAVDCCHSRGISHRDLKLENVLLDHNGDVKVSDFGLSALPEQVRNDGLLHTQCGTPAYVAPEVLRRKGYDGAKADLWSCGVLLYVLLAGFLPFQEENLMKLYSKVFKADFKMPAWFSAGAQNLISLLLVTDPKKRITVEEIMDHPWFKKGYSAPSIDEFLFIDPDDDAVAVPPAMKDTPPFYNAFDLISSMSSGFDLSGMFENGIKVGTAFTSRKSAGEIMEMLEKVGKGLGFKTVRSKEYKVRFEGTNCGRKGRLGVTAELFEVTPEVAVVEFSKTAGDYLDYTKFCGEELRQGLRDIVWTWQGDDDVSSNRGD